MQDIQGRPLRVALVTSSYNYIADGVALTLNRLVGWLEAQGVNVKVFAPTADRPAFAHQGELVSVPSFPLPGRPEYRLALGAAGVQIGTAYLLCPEATTSAIHRAALQREAASWTAVTNVFTGARPRDR